MRDFLRGRSGAIVAIAFTLLVGVAVFWSLKGTMTTAGSDANRRTYICSKTLKAYELTVDPSTPLPAPSPYSGSNTGYPAELCYWTKDGKIKSDPTPVLLTMWTSEDYANPPPTFCPDCGRLVVRHNAMPKSGDKAPPTQSEYESRRAMNNSSSTTR